jgi:hypothetical protein
MLKIKNPNIEIRNKQRKSHAHALTLALDRHHRKSEYRISKSETDRENPKDGTPITRIVTNLLLIKTASGIVEKFVRISEIRVSVSLSVSVNSWGSSSTTRSVRFIRENSCNSCLKSVRAHWCPVLHKTIRFHSSESPPKLTNRPSRSFEAAR